MPKYIEILPDGTRQVVKYKIGNDGPVTRYLSAVKRLRWKKKHPNSPDRKGDNLLAKTVREFESERARSRRLRDERAAHGSRGFAHGMARNKPPQSLRAANVSISGCDGKLNRTTISEPTVPWPPVEVQQTAQLPDIQQVKPDYATASQQSPLLRSGHGSTAGESPIASAQERT
jgi:hypothetical protein